MRNTIRKAAHNLLPPDLTLRLFIIGYGSGMAGAAHQISQSSEGATALGVLHAVSIIMGLWLAIRLIRWQCAFMSRHSTGVATQGWIQSASIIHHG